MKKLLLLSALLLQGCAMFSSMDAHFTGEQFDQPKVEQNIFLKKSDNKLDAPAGGPIAVAVYGFQDKTGQRKSLPTIASLSSAVTQGADSYLIKALQDVGEGRWFIVLERGGLDNLIKERQMIRQMREQYQGRDAQLLPPMMFAGIILEGGIVGYDSNTTTGGSGVRILGVGPSTQYQSDTVTINLRAVSVSTGEVLTSVTVTKTVMSYMDKFSVLRFVSEGTQAVEAETGTSINESINKATSLAIQAAVVDTIREGARKGHWSFKGNTNELVQTQTPSKDTPKTTTTLPQPSITKDSGGSKEDRPEPKVEPKAEIKIEPKVEPKVQPKVEEVKTVSQSKVEIKPTTGIIVAWVNMRVNQNKNSEKVKQLAPNDSVEIIKTEENFLLVRIDKKEGWVNKNYVRLLG